MCSCICLWQVSETFSRYTIIHHCLTVRVIAKRYRHNIEQMYRLSTNYITVFVKGKLELVRLSLIHIHV